MIEGSPAFTRLLNREDVLVQITLPPEISMDTLPERAFVLAGQSRVPVRLVSVAARTDPKIQGLSGFYVAPGSAHLIPGMSLPAALTAGPEVAGVVVPASAVVYTEGRAWIYVQDAPHAFVRRAIQTDMAVTGDSYLARSVPPGTKVVVRGAQQLLSDEYRAQIQVGEDGG